MNSLSVLVGGIARPPSFLNTSTTHSPMALSPTPAPHMSAHQINALKNPTLSLPTTNSQQRGKNLLYIPRVRSRTNRGAGGFDRNSTIFFPTRQFQWINTRGGAAAPSSPRAGHTRIEPFVACLRGVFAEWRARGRPHAITPLVTRLIFIYRRDRFLPLTSSFRFPSFFPRRVPHFTTSLSPLQLNVCIYFSLKFVPCFVRVTVLLEVSGVKNAVTDSSSQGK